MSPKVAPEHDHVWETGKTARGAFKKRCSVKRCRFHGWRSRPAPRGRRGNHLTYLDKKVTSRAMIRDKMFCIATFFLTGVKVTPQDPHHIAKKGTHRGPDVRNDPAYVIWLTRAMHEKTETGELKITAEEYQGRVLWVISMEFELKDGSKQLRSSVRVVDHDVVTVERRKSRIKKGAFAC